MMSHSDLLVDRVVLVTGAGRGIGRAIALMAARHGAKVVLNARSDGSLQPVAAEISAVGGSSPESICFDVSDPEQVKAGFSAVAKRLGRLDVLVNNAGILRDALLPMSAPAMLREVFETNCFGTFYCSQFASRLMARQGAGSIINIASIIGVIGNEGQTVYGASKAAVIGLTKSLAKEVAPQGVRVNAVAPGFIDTDMIKAVPAEKAERIRQSIKMGRLGTPEDVAGVCVFLASGLSGYVTGQVIGVDGGMVV